MTPTPEAVRPRSPFWDAVVLGLVSYYLTSTIPMLGAAIGHESIRLPTHPLAKRTDLIRSLANWDGEHYVAILDRGYTYDPGRPSNVAFFPAYPLLGRALAWGTGVPPEVSLLIVSHLCLAASFVLLADYLRCRTVQKPSGWATYTLLAFGLFPTTFFWRMAYSESLFILFCLLIFCGMERQWPLPVLAVLVGFASGTRPVGLALLLPFLLHLRSASAGLGSFLKRVVVYVPLACWGIGGYMTYLQAAFGDPLVFAKTQVHWNMRPQEDLLSKAVAYLSMEPLWSVVDPNCQCYWKRHESGGNALLTLHVTNPLYFLLSVTLTVVGGWRGWLNPRELIFSATLLLVPYLMRGDVMCMAGSARFAAAIFPLYLVLGRLLAQVPFPLAGGALCLSGFVLGTYAALFASWNRYF